MALHKIGTKTKEIGVKTKDKDEKLTKSQKAYEKSVTGIKSMNESMKKAEKYNADRIFTTAKGQKVKRIKTKKMGSFGKSFI